MFAYLHGINVGAFIYIFWRLLIIYKNIAFLTENFITLSNATAETKRGEFLGWYTRRMIRTYSILSFRAISCYELFDYSLFPCLVLYCKCLFCLPSPVSLGSLKQASLHGCNAFVTWCHVYLRGRGNSIVDRSNVTADTQFHSIFDLPWTQELENIKESLIIPCHA